MEKYFKDIKYLKYNNIKLDTNTTIKDLLIINGHLNSKTGSYNLDKWYNLINKINNNLLINFENNNNILEIGCGAGALLKYYYNKNCKIYGIDLSLKMIEISKIVMPLGNFYISEASNLINIKSNSINYLLSHSCFQYFSNINYLKLVISEIIRVLKPNGKIYISDIIDDNLKDEILEYRKKKIGLEKYNELYKNLKHFSITKQKFIELLNNNFKNIKIINSDKRGDENKFFRYDITAILK